jgi:hypothetical protein
MRVGDQVPADNPTGEKDTEFGDTVDPPNWRKLVLLAPKKDGSTADVELLRPLWWLEEQQAEVGGTVDIQVPECGIEGRAEVLAIEPCPPIKPRPGLRVVTGTFKHRASQVLDVYVEGLDEPIGTTPNHPFWSEDRQTFVRADELKAGEHLRAFNGTPIVRRVVPLADPEPVLTSKSNATTSTTSREAAYLFITVSGTCRGGSMKHESWISWVCRGHRVRLSF